MLCNVFSLPHTNTLASHQWRTLTYSWCRAFINIEFMSQEFWILLLLDFFMIVMRDADLWDELGKCLKKTCGKRLGKAISFAMAVASGDTDLAAAELDDEERGLEGSKTRRRKYFKVRMVASQAVASEFVVTGCFLAISASTFIMNKSGFVAYMQLIPLHAGVSADCDDPCVCDGDGAVGGVYTNLEGGCVFRSSLESGIGAVDISELTHRLCMVPNACLDIGNSTAVILDAATGGNNEWKQPGPYQFALCSLGSPTSDVCDPGADQVRSNTMSFVVVVSNLQPACVLGSCVYVLSPPYVCTCVAVSDIRTMRWQFVAQILALGLSKLILMCKVRRMVDDGNQERRKMLWRENKATQRIVEEIEAIEATRQAEESFQRPMEIRDSGNLTPKQRVRRGIRAWMFTRRLTLAAKRKDTVEKLVLEVAEAVAEHWKDIQWYYFAVATQTMISIFFYVSFILDAGAA